MTKLILLDSLLQEVCIKCMWDYIAHSYSGIVSLESQWSSTILRFYLVCMHTQYLWLMPKYWLNTIFVADANILAEYWHEPNDTIYWEGPLSCGMYGTIAPKFWSCWRQKCYRNPFLGHFETLKEYGRHCYRYMGKVKFFRAIWITKRCQKRDFCSGRALKAPPLW